MIVMKDIFLDLGRSRDLIKFENCELGAGQRILIKIDWPLSFYKMLFIAMCLLLYGL